MFSICKRPMPHFGELHGYAYCSSLFEGEGDRPRSINVMQRIVNDAVVKHKPTSIGVSENACAYAVSLCFGYEGDDAITRFMNM